MFDILAHLKPQRLPPGLVFLYSCANVPYARCKTVFMLPCKHVLDSFAYMACVAPLANQT